MADSVVTLAVTDVNKSRRSTIRTVKVTVSAGDYDTTGGLPIDLTTVTNPNNLAGAKFGRNPTNFTIKNSYGVYQARLTPGAALTNWILRIYQTGTSADSVFNEVADEGTISTTATGSTSFLIDFISPSNL
jgi:hypothetical protein